MDAADARPDERLATGDLGLGVPLDAAGLITDGRIERVAPAAIEEVAEEPGLEASDRHDDVVGERVGLLGAEGSGDCQRRDEWCDRRLAGHFRGGRLVGLERDTVDRVRQQLEQGGIDDDARRG